MLFTTSVAQNSYVNSEHFLHICHFIKLTLYMYMPISNQAVKKYYQISCNLSFHLNIKGKGFKNYLRTTCLSQLAYFAF